MDDRSVRYEKFFIVQCRTIDSVSAQNRVEEKKKTVPPVSASKSTVKARFVPTKWETVDPNAVAAQGISHLSRRFSSLKIFSSSPQP